MGKRVLCPNCGVHHYIEEAKSKVSSFESTTRRPYRSDAATIPLSQPGLSRDVPTNLPSIDTHVKIPFRQTVISGLLDAPIGIAIGLGIGLGVAGMADAASQDSFTLAAYILITGTGGAIGGAVAFCWTARGEWPKRLREYDALLWVEEITGLDLNGDGEIGEPTESETLKIEIHDQSGRTRLLLELNTDRERFSELARLVMVVNEGFSEETAKKAGYTRKEWEEIRDNLIDLGVAAWKDKKHHKQGCYLREDGYRIFSGALTPSLPAGDVPKKAIGASERRKTNDI